TETRNQESGRELLDLDRAARLGDLLLDVLRVVLRHARLDLLRRAVDEILGLLEAEVGDLADRLDHLDLVRARIGEDDGELRLLRRRLGRRRRSRAAAHAGNRNRGSLDAPLLLELLGQVGNLHDREVRELIDDGVHVHVGHCPSPFLYLVVSAARSLADRRYMKFCAPAESVRTRSVAGAMKVASSFARSSSLPGIVASPSTPLTSRTPSKNPPLRTNFSWSLANLAATFAGADGLSYERIIAVGPSRYFDIP